MADQPPSHRSAVITGGCVVFASLITVGIPPLIGRFWGAPPPTKSYTTLYVSGIEKLLARSPEIASTDGNEKPSRGSSVVSAFTPQQANRGTCSSSDSRLDATGGNASVASNSINYSSTVTITNTGKTELIIAANGTANIVTSNGGNGAPITSLPFSNSGDFKEFVSKGVTISAGRSMTIATNAFSASFVQEPAAKMDVTIPLRIIDPSVQPLMQRTGTVSCFGIPVQSK